MEVESFCANKNKGASKTNKSTKALFFISGYNLIKAEKKVEVKLKDEYYGNNYHKCAEDLPGF